jgi:murein DD-endopeptidase MepM/ murein hydrolase activator NlpD
LLAITVLVAGEPPAAPQGAQPDSRSVSVAQALGIDSSSKVEDRSLTQEGGLLEQLAVSRAERETEQAAAAQAQDQAEQAARAEAEARAAAEAKAAAEAARPTAVMPIDAARMTSSFGPRWGTLHAGVDLAAPMMTPEFAAMDGIVLQAGPASGFGLAVYIQHANGDVTVYGHMEKILVSAGQVVRAGDTIALVGNRGQSTGPHLHFEVRIGGLNGEPVDPLGYLRQWGVQM